ncbi:outer membrane beta-barrel protein [Synoicihabitans lomoniglobus]|uniref:Outer membrane beta-barrel protein n=1 Tax=Synoicihabitans lomoniglobus TaxID=2909285 RepID=A0AAE9ZV46_9BACT|nr:outer membrane beta-barrel protein [Opitutaceae bacterium LMO-M01]WED63629.1 outer membrane beta-barrel protein [Opitutaceae bacterium LMO-M01]
MKSVFVSLLSLLTGVSAWAQTGFFAEAGVGHLSLSGAKYSIANVALSSSGGNTVPGTAGPFTTNDSFSREDDHATVPFIAAGYTFSENLGLRFTYHHIGDLTTIADYDVIIGGDAVAGSVHTVFQDTTRLFTLSPEFSWSVNQTIELTVSPELNLVLNRATITTTTDDVSIMIVPTSPYSDESVTFGGSADVKFHLSPQASLVVRYKYTDLKPSRDRTGHLISASLRWHF